MSMKGCKWSLIINLFRQTSGPNSWEHTPHQYGTNTSLHSAFMKTGVNDFIGSAPHTNPTISPKQLVLWLQLATSPAQMRSYFRCGGVNRGTLVGLLLPYPMEAKERCTELWDMLVEPPALNVDVMFIRVARLFTRTVLARCHQSWSLSTLWGIADSVGYWAVLCVILRLLSGSDLCLYFRFVRSAWSLDSLPCLVSTGLYFGYWFCLFLFWYVWSGFAAEPTYLISQWIWLCFYLCSHRVTSVLQEVSRTFNPDRFFSAWIINSSNKINS